MAYLAPSGKTCILQLKQYMFDIFNVIVKPHSFYSILTAIWAVLLMKLLWAFKTIYRK